MPQPSATGTGVALDDRLRLAALGLNADPEVRKQVAHDQ
jgi:hypothetical protein